MSGEREEQPESILANLQPFEWSDELAVSYEITVELVNQVVGGYTGLICREETKASPDLAAIEGWEEAQRYYIEQCRSLLPTDAEGVARLRTECAEAIRRLRTEF